MPVAGTVILGGGNAIPVAGTTIPGGGSAIPVAELCPASEPRVEEGVLANGTENAAAGAAEVP